MEHAKMPTQLKEDILKKLLTVGTIIACAIKILLSNLFVPTFLCSRRKAQSAGMAQHDRRLSLPPGPRPWPIIGNLAALGALPHQALAKLGKTYGPLMYLRLGSVPTIIVSSPEMAQQILKTHDKVFASRPRVTSCEIMGYGSQNFGFLPYGDDWRNARKLFVSELVSARRMQDTRKVRTEEILLMLRSVVEASQTDGGSTKAAVRMFSQFFQMATNIVMRLMVSKRMFGPSDSTTFGNTEFEETVVELFRLFGVFNIGDFIPSLKRFEIQGYEKQMKAVHKKIDAFFQSLLDTRAEELRSGNHDMNESKDFMDVLLTHPTETTGKPMNQDQIKGMLVDVLLAGTDTTAITLEWALSELLKNPAALRKCHEELDAVVGRERLVDESDLPNLPYLRAVVKETTRLHPAGALMLPHESVDDCDVAGYHIPAKSRVMVNVWAIGRDAAVWDRALEFHPERFLPDQMDSNIDVHGQHFKLLPFGSGRRMCPGKSLGLRVLEYTLAVLLQSCDWELPATMSPDDLDMSEKFALGVAKAVELEAVATPRLPASVISLASSSPSI